jgi:hypothetical protein
MEEGERSTVPAGLTPSIAGKPHSARSSGSFLRAW